MPEAARRLWGRYRQGNTLDLGRVIVVVPGQRAGRRLQELLAYLAEDEHLRFTPPEVVTEGKLPEMLYTPKLPFATDIVQDLAWASVLRDLPATQRQHLAPHPPAAGDTLRWLELAKALRGLHRELAADGLDFAAVVKHGPRLDTFNESARWKTLAELQRRYLLLLDQQLLWDIQTARLKAIEFREVNTESDVILLGTVDLNTTLRQMLDQVADKVTAYVVAPEDFSNRFDKHGCLIPEAWSDASVPLRDEQLRQVGDPEQQADAVTDWLAELGGRFRSDEVVIGVPDEALVPSLQRQLQQCGVRARWVEGARLAEAGPFRLLAAAAEFAGGRRYEDLAALVRHPDVEEWLGKQKSEVRGQKSEVRSQESVGKPQDERSESWGSGAGKLQGSPPRAQSLPAQLDRFYNEHLPSRMRGSIAFANSTAWPDLAPALTAIEQWLAAAAGEHPLRRWAQVFRELLDTVYGDRELVLDRPADEVLHRTLSKLLNECERLQAAPEALDTAPLSAADAFRIAMGPLGEEYLPPPAEPDAVEILGWLELPLDDSQGLVVTSFNEGFVPKSTGADAFLPNRLRRELNLLHNERRYARDAYATSVLCHARPELRVVFGRRDTRNDPLQPSRLLFACPDDQLVDRARRFFGEPQAPAGPRRLLLAPEGTIPAESAFKAPKPTDWNRPERISVTRFKAYLACPYRYYLRHVRKIEAIDDAARELDGKAFGNLLHRVLGAFGKAAPDLRDSDRPEQIFEFLDAELLAQAWKVYGPDQRRPAIRLQLEQARQRLRTFASCQVELARTGWRIIHVEDDQHDEDHTKRAELEVPFPVGGAAVSLVGRIDRIDFHETTSTIRILDYKTADSAEKPDQTHRDRKGWLVDAAGNLVRLDADSADRDRKGWIDLQLPLYRLLCRDRRLKLPAAASIQLGYFNIPKKLEETAVAVAEWDEIVLADAEDVARAVVRQIASGVFWPPVYDPVPEYAEDLAPICLDNTYGRPVLSDDDAGGPA
ncbi:MAG: PD-(D/E)XK nuclease family protein [Gemmataceae bacterium]|nr:PD-(D/E)XK nuclease family protein [Gemmataceae bacterium]